ncbi:Superoxide dismutase [Mn] [Friedmanniomyces simplex]|uniref:superoxide dismutase n=1 Tax=Friedmanniomyces simplex TaxID=329884 RepID=A0A4U0WN59_9PEZI|nr:Superoxide dismutase [Mn] [Friedmanniomyces simplex]
MHFANLTLGWMLSLAQSRLGVGPLVHNKLGSDTSFPAPPTTILYTLPPLDYNYEALEPHFDAETMRIHHTKHHQTYITNLNAALQGNEFSSLDIDELMTRFNDLPADKKAVVRNQGGGHANHSFFWKNLTPNATALADGSPLKTGIEDTFSSFEVFQQAFEKAATSVFGSGWAWLILTDTGELRVVTTANQDSPLMGESVVGAGAAGFPIMGLDVWEHAYYLRYRNVRPDYIKAYWQVVNWEFASGRYMEARGSMVQPEAL